MDLFLSHLHYFKGLFNKNDLWVFFHRDGLGLLEELLLLLLLLMLVGKPCGCVVCRPLTGPFDVGVDPFQVSPI
jgi:hypothetical protein